MAEEWPGWLPVLMANVDVKGFAVVRVVRVGIKTVRVGIRKGICSGNSSKGRNNKSKGRNT